MSTWRHTATTFLICLVYLAAMPAAADSLTTLVTRTGAGLSLQWQDSDPGDGYAVTHTELLTTPDWTYSGDIDQWPTDATNWLVQLEMPTAFFRVERADRGKLVSVTLLDTFSVQDIAFGLLFYGIEGVTPTYPVAVYSLSYETFDPRGQSTVANGALCLPVGPASGPMVSYQHGTIFESIDSPSNAGAIDQFVGIALATEGYIASLPDYLGLGLDSPPLHPYVHARSEAVASVDMLRASTAYLATVTNPAPNGFLFLAGYSQGGHATLALQREIETRHPEFPVTASAPMAGPHDLSGAMREAILSDVPYGSPSYLPYALFGLNSVYRFFDSASEILVEPYASTLPPLMDGLHSGGDIDAAMPAVPKQIFKPEFLADFETNSVNPFRLALAANDTYRDWLPATTTRFFHCAGDTIVPQANSIRAVSNFVARGAGSVALFDPAPAADHEDGALPSFQAAKAWFDSFRDLTPF